MLIYALAAHSDVMKSFFEPLMADALKLIKRSLTKAKAAKHYIRKVFVCGGGFGNDRFFEDFSQRLLGETEVTICERIQE
jgi:1,6-anhydro-N-acetylmuramate kinase